MEVDRVFMDQDADPSSSEPKTPLGVPCGCAVLAFVVPCGCAVVAFGVPCGCAVLVLLSLVGMLLSPLLSLELASSSC